MPRLCHPEPNIGSANGLLGADSFVPSSMSDRGGLILGYYLALLLLLVALVLYRVVNGQRLGRLLRAAPRETRGLCRSSRHRLSHHAHPGIPDLLGGIGGRRRLLRDNLNSRRHASLFTMDQLLLLLAMVVVGGIGTAEGAVVGTLIVVLFDKVFIGLGPIRLILIAGIMLGTVLFLRGGLLGIPAQYLAWRGKRRSERRGRHSSKGGEVMPEEAIEISDKQAIFVRRFDARLRAELKKLITEDLIKEHRATFGQRRSDALERVLTYFRGVAVTDRCPFSRSSPSRSTASRRSPAGGAFRHASSTTRCSPASTTRCMASFSSGCRILSIRESSRGTQAMAYIRISAYTDKLSVKPGDTLRVMASADATYSVRAQLVQLIHGDEHPDGPGFVERPVASTIDREWPASKQYIQKGNFLHVADPQRRLAPTGPFTLHAYIFPTLPGEGRQVLLGRWSVDATSGFALGINPSGRLEFWVGDGPAPMRLRRRSSLFRASGILSRRATIRLVVSRPSIRKR